MTETCECGRPIATTAEKWLDLAYHYDRLAAIMRGSGRKGGELAAIKSARIARRAAASAA